MDGAADEFDLPEPIIQIVQSFLTTKQAARTTLLSTSWLSAWLTRPNLNFDDADFCPSHFDHYRRLNLKFLEFAERTLERYENSNLEIHSFRMSMKYLKYEATVTFTKLVRRALKLGPTRLTFEFGDRYYAFPIPNEVFGIENLVSLTAQGCVINSNRDEVCCSSLQFLSLECVLMRRTTIFHIISICPLIEKLSLCKVQVDCRYCGRDDGLLAIISPLHRLKSLVLKHVDFDTLFLAHLSSKLPSLIDFTLHILSINREEILISSPTLELLDINMENEFGFRNTGKVVKLDVPSIRKLTFACSNLPDELYVTSNSTGWESCVSVKNENCSSSWNASWFYCLSNFIDKFKFSRISLLSLHIYDIGLFDYEVGEVRGLPTPEIVEIENLTIYDLKFMTTQRCYALFDKLFHMCHPKVINILSVSTYQTNILNFLVKSILDARDAKVQTPNQYYLMHGLNEYIKEARAQVFDKAVSTWRDVTLDSLLDEDSTTRRNFLDFRFHLNWKE